VYSNVYCILAVFECVLWYINEICYFFFFGASLSHTFSLSLSLSPSTYMYINIFIYICLRIYMSTYIYTSLQSGSKCAMSHNTGQTYFYQARRSRSITYTQIYISMHGSHLYISYRCVHISIHVQPHCLCTNPRVVVTSHASVLGSKSHMNESCVTYYR